jgi:hypothetical protein
MRTLILAGLSLALSLAAVPGAAQQLEPPRG